VWHSLPRFASTKREKTATCDRSTSSFAIAARFVITRTVPSVVNSICFLQTPTMISRIVLAIVLATHLILIAGCGPDAPQAPKDRRPTYPVTGEVTIDGNPGAYVTIMFIPISDLSKVEDASYNSGCGAQADSQGKFMANTYAQGDGAPAGEYVLVFDWVGPTGANPRQVDISGSDTVPDPTAQKFNRKYGRSSARKKEFTIKVEEGKPTDVGKLELKTK
jgi:hypothetical protein